MGVDTNALIPGHLTAQEVAQLVERTYRPPSGAHVLEGSIEDMAHIAFRQHWRVGRAETERRMTVFLNGDCASEYEWVRIKPSHAVAQATEASEARKRAYEERALF